MNKAVTLCMHCCGERSLGVVMECDALDCRLNHTRARLKLACDDMAALESLLVAGYTAMEGGDPAVVNW